MFCLFVQFLYFYSFDIQKTQQNIHRRQVGVVYETKLEEEKKKNKLKK